MENKIKKCLRCKNEINVNATRCSHCQANLSSSSKGLSGIIKSLIIVSAVMILLSMIFSGMSESSKTESNALPDTSADMQPNVLSISSLRSYREYSQSCVTGVAKNISANTLEFVQAIVLFEGENHSFIKSDSQYLQFESFLPQQISPFEVCINDPDSQVKGEI